MHLPNMRIVAILACVSAESAAEDNIVKKMYKNNTNCSPALSSVADHSVYTITAYMAMVPGATVNCTAIAANSTTCQADGPSDSMFLNCLATKPSYGTDKTCITSAAMTLGMAEWAAAENGCLNASGDCVHETPTTCDEVKALFADGLSSGVQGCGSTCTSDSLKMFIGRSTSGCSCSVGTSGTSTSSEDNSTLDGGSGTSEQSSQSNNSAGGVTNESNSSEGTSAVIINTAYMKTIPSLVLMVVSASIMHMCASS